MKKLFSIMLLLLSFECFSQRAREVLEDGIVIKAREKAFLKFTNDGLKYDIGQRASDFITLPDSSIFLTARRGVNMYLKPLNPLNYSFNTELKIIPDLVNEEAGTALAAITDLLKQLSASATENAGISGGPSNECQMRFTKLMDDEQKLRGLLEEDKKDSVNALFKLLKALSFEDEKTTADSIQFINVLLQPINQHYKNIEQALTNFKKEVNDYPCDTPDHHYIVKYVFNEVAEKLTELKNGQYKRVKLLIALHKLVSDAQVKASLEKDGLRWMQHLGEVAVNRGEISVYTVTIKESGYVLSDKGDISEASTKEKAKRVIRFRSFDRFIPEASAGTAFTDLTFLKYGTQTDTTTGAETVAAAGEERFKKLNFTAMINLNYFIPNSPLHPFLQLGIGANTDYPTFFTGAGFRMNFKPLRRFAFAFGVASTWIKTLDKLKIGDTVSGTAELEKDIKHEFKWPPKPYLGIQVNL
jgi:hypothetical protein